MIVHKIYNDKYRELISLNPDIYKKNEYKSNLKNFKVSEEEKERISNSRRKRRIREIALCNDFEFFGTFTITSNLNYINRYDLEECALKAKKMMKAFQRKYKEFKYVYVFETHKDGAYHFHGLFKGINDLYVNDNGFYSSEFWDTLGWNSFSKIKDYNKACNYITKYISKNPIILDSGYVYNCSRGLKKPTVEIMIDEDLQNIFGNKNIYENGVKVGEEADYYIGEYCQKKGFDISTLTEKQKLKLNAFYNKNDEFFQNDNNSITNWFKLFTNIDNSFKIKINP